MIFMTFGPGAFFLYHWQRS